jgi:preprotein translocase subunit SecA
MNEQRKVIYALRDQVLDQVDLREKIVEEYLPNAVNALVEAHCVSEYNEEWDVEGLITEVRTYWPSTLTTEQLKQSVSTNELYEMLMDEALTYYEAREAELTPEIMRSVERTVMLRIIDQRWRSHLYEMDYLREGINLRAMGQRDPLTEWQREGFDMFGQMMQGVWQDFIRYVMHVQVQVNRPPLAVGETPTLPSAPPEDQPAPVQNMQYSAPEDPSASGGAASLAAAAAAGPQTDQPSRSNGNGQGPGADKEPVNTPVVKTDWDKTPRNAPCPCGSGKKYKLCHGR